jgi:hypothetical protein
MGLYSLHVLSHLDCIVLVASCSDLGRLGCGKVTGELHCDGYSRGRGVRLLHLPSQLTAAGRPHKNIKNRMGAALYGDSLAMRGAGAYYVRYFVLERVLNLVPVLSRSAVRRVQPMLNLVPCVHLLSTSVRTLFSRSGEDAVQLCVHSNETAHGHPGHTLKQRIYI